MAVRPIQVDVYELIALLVAKSNVVSSNLANWPYPTALDIDEVGDVIKRMAELHAVLRETIAQMPRREIKGQGVTATRNAPTN